MARMPSSAPVSARDPLAGAWDAAAAENRRLQAKNDPLAPVARPDPRRTDVFRRGPDGKLHPIEGWHTTGPFDFGTWARNIDWGGVVTDLGDIAAGAWGGVRGMNNIGDRVATLWGTGRAVQKDLEDAEKRAKAKP